MAICFFPLREFSIFQMPLDFFLVNASLLVVTAWVWILFPSWIDPNILNEKTERTERRKEGEKAIGMHVNLFFSVPEKAMSILITSCYGN